MPKRKAHIPLGKSISWLPIDNRILLPLFSFGRVSGLSKMFLTIEIILSVFVVFGTVLLVILKILF